MSTLWIFECRACGADIPCALISDAEGPKHCPYHEHNKANWHEVETREVSDDAE